ncbi:MAG: molybdenum cofactor biosynthesis protein MoaE [Actinomycetota bacterium]|nr:molybdenum cofactor biosynthesis protein MoaE [Actinomycetota bacterium]
MGLAPPAFGDDWLELTPDALPSGTATEWAVQPGCGAVVSFVGTVRDHAERRPGVVCLEYEAYEEEVRPRLVSVAKAARASWPDIGRIALLHRTGELGVTEISVVVVVSAPHRVEAFEAARFCIDSVKASTPIWKRERWAHGDDWSSSAQPIADMVARP